MLEARERVGGRVWNHDLGHGHITERGATFIGPTQDRVLALAHELGVGKFPAYDSGQNVYGPLLPFEHQLTERYGQGTLTNMAAVYDRPFWRTPG